MSTFVIHIALLGPTCVCTTQPLGSPHAMHQRTLTMVVFLGKRLPDRAKR